MSAAGLYATGADLLLEPVIHLRHAGLNRLQLMGRLDLRRLSDRSKPTRALRHGAHKLRRNAQDVQHVVVSLVSGLNSALATNLHRHQISDSQTLEHVRHRT